MTVDGIHAERWTTAGTFTMLSSSRLYVGGTDQSVSLPGVRPKNNFVGCLRKVGSVSSLMGLSFWDKFRMLA